MDSFLYFPEIRIKMNIAIISSTQDTASINIKERLLENYGFVKTGMKFDGSEVYGRLANEKDINLYTINTPLITRDGLDKKIDADVFLFISRHKADGGRASLTVHPIGNFGKAGAGGKDGQLGISNPGYLKKILKELAKNIEGSEYEATVESTHHGPFMEKPALFVELGSNEKYWEDKEGAKIVAKSLMNAIENANNKNMPITNSSNKKSNSFESKNNGNNNYKSVFVVGGSHYSHVANKALLNSDFSVSHICPKHNLENLDEGMLKQAIEKSEPKASFVLLDWKGMGKEKQRILEMLEKSSIEYKRSDKFFSQ